MHCDCLQGACSCVESRASRHIRKLVCTRFPSQYNDVVLVLEGKLVIGLRFNIVCHSELVLVLEENLLDLRFTLRCNEFVGNTLVLVLQGKLACTGFPYSEMLF